MQRIHILQQLLRQEVEGLATGNCAALNGGSTLDTTERQPPVAEDSSTLSAPAHKSETPLALPEHSGVTEALPAEEREEPQACPGEDTKESQPCSTTELKPPVPHRAEPEPPAPCLPALAGPPLPSCRGQAEPLRLALGYSWEHRQPALCKLETQSLAQSPVAVRGLQQPPA